MSIQKNRLVLSVLIAAGLALSACGGPQVTATPQVVQKETLAPTPTPPPPATATPEAAKHAGTLRVALSTFPNSIDVAKSSERNAHNAAWQLFDSLVYVDDAGDVVPALADRWDISEDGTQYTFYLRKDVTFHNGEPFDADAVLFSWERGKRPEMQWKDKWAMAESVEKIDAYTVKITTDGPKPLLLRSIAAFWAMVPPKYIAEVGEEGFAAHPVGTGPFMFEEWIPDDHITYKANPDYWQDGLPKVETLIFKPIPESAKRVAAITTGQVDIVGRLSVEEAQSLMGLPGVEVINYPVARIYYIAFNNLTSGVGQPTENPKVRQAMNYAINVDEIITVYFNGYAKPATGLVASGELGYGAVEPFGHDPDKARQLLAEAGYADGFEIDFACPSGAYARFEQVCEAIQFYLAEVGIEAKLELLESGQFWDLEAEKKLPPLFGDSWSEVSGEAYNRLNGALGGMEASFSAWSDAGIDRLLGEIATTVDEEQRAALYGELQVYMQDNPPFIYLYEPMTFEAVTPWVQDYHPRPAEDYFLMNTWISQ